MYTDFTLCLIVSYIFKLKLITSELFKHGRTLSEKNYTKKSFWYLSFFQIKTPRKRGRTKQDFLDFCLTVLNYADYHPDDDDHKVCVHIYIQQNKYTGVVHGFVCVNCSRLTRLSSNLTMFQMHLRFQRPSASDLQKSFSVY